MLLSTPSGPTGMRGATPSMPDCRERPGMSGALHGSCRRAAAFRLTLPTLQGAPEGAYSLRRARAAQSRTGRPYMEGWTRGKSNPVSRRTRMGSCAVSNPHRARSARRGLVAGTDSSERRTGASVRLARCRGVRGTPPSLMGGAQGVPRRPALPGRALRRMTFSAVSCGCSHRHETFSARSVD